MRIAVLPVNDTACGHYRQLWPSRAIQAAGLAEVIEDWKGPTFLWEREWTGDKPPPDVRPVGLAPYDADVVVLQRPAYMYHVAQIAWLQAQGIKVVVDIDDHFAAIPKQSVAWSGYQTPETNVGYLLEACKMADVVTCSTPGLVKRYGFGKGLLVRNLVPEAYLKLETDKIPHSIGWAGAVGTHPGDLETIGTGVTRSLRSSGWHFYVVGRGEGVQQALRLDRPPKASGWLSFGTFASGMALLELGIVPLCDNYFNTVGKSWLKMAEFAALGVPIVVSPTPENTELHRSGVGVLAGSPSSWERRLRQLFRSHEYRADLAGRGREAMAQYTYEAPENAERWFSAWASACRQPAA